jgi:hypothetical protein
LLETAAMSFRCPDCNALTLRITSTIELGPDGDSDENTVQTVECASCGLAALAKYEESRRGSSDRFHHRGWRVSKADFDRVKAAILACPRRHLPPRLQPGGRRGPCRCLAHTTWGSDLPRAGVTLEDRFDIDS